jgi:hypothetical protein
MRLKEGYLDRVLDEVGVLASRVALLNGRFAKLKVSVKLEHYWELENIRNRFAEFKRRVEKLADADDQEAARLQEAAEATWKDLINAVDMLLAALP